MQIVIDIRKEIYQNVLNGTYCGTLYEAMINGTPLPKGHGDLIDKSDLLTTTDIREDGSEFTYVSYSEINNATIVVEADKEDKE